MSSGAPVRTAMWADWVALNLPGLFWFQNAAANGFAAAGGLLSTPGDFVYDVIDFLADMGVQLGAAPKVSIPGLIVSGQTPVANSGFNGYCAQIAIPDFVINKQRENGLADWFIPDGSLGSPLTSPPNEMGDGSRRIALQIENVLIAQTFNQDLSPVPQNLTTLLTTLGYFAMSAKFRGYGAVRDGAQTQDTPVTSSVLVGSAPTAFPQMALPADDSSTGPVDFTQGDGRVLARLQTLVEIPNTVAPGDVIDLIGAMAFTQDTQNAEFGVQWYAAKYRWLVTPYPQESNTTVQLLTADDEGQPRTDESPFQP